MIIDFIIALVVYDAAKFIIRCVFSVLNKQAYDKEHEIQSEVKTFEEKLREKMEQNQKD